VEDFDDPLGLGTARSRLSEEETVKRMLDTGVQIARDQGLKVSFDLLRLEDVIAEAGVSRSAVYKRWPRKEQFYSQVLLRLAGEAHPALAAYDVGTELTAIDVALAHLDWFATPKGRHKLFVEMCREGALQNFTVLRERKEWQVYMALHATLSSLPDNRFQDAMREALRASEEAFIDKMSDFYIRMIEVLGYRMKPAVGDVGYAEFAALGAAIVEGLVMTSSATPMLSEQRFMIDPFGTGELVDWSYPALGFTSIALALVEPDPTVRWDAARISAIEPLLRTARATSERGQLKDPPESPQLVNQGHLTKA